MPMMDGYECCMKIHLLLDEVRVVEKPKIYAVTGHVESEYQRKAIKSGMDSLFAKPISICCLAQALLEKRFEIQVPEQLVKELA
mmetsp:Transcript_17575/g.27152  ORF Transcript_17575/g.27152 Transcript_17575/m.27152 type:complete len:84 (+) Transcript_17575:2076-2327(+)